MNSYHTPVLLGESIKGLNIKKNGIYIDATFGGGGHSKEILKNLSSKGRLVAFDRDCDVLINNDFGDSNFTFINENFEHLKKFLKNIGIEKVHGIHADLGVSSHQIDSPERGFSYRFNSSLDMRMNKNNEVDASFIVNKYSKSMLTEIFNNYADLKIGKKISNEIQKYRTSKLIKSTFDLNDAISHLFSKKFLNKNLSRVYQAIRIEVNQEVKSLKSLLKQSSELLVPGGRLCIISYHSIEDRMVKRFIKNGDFNSEVTKDFYGNSLLDFKIIGKLIRPKDAEIKLNKRSRSAILRVAEKM